jgi:hypothetical protein
MAKGNAKLAARDESGLINRSKNASSFEAFRAKHVEDTFSILRKLWASARALA